MMYRRALQILRRLCAFLILFGAFHRLPAATFQVTTIADSGSGSLRSAIIAANATPGADVIVFNIPGAGTQTITLNSNLPPVMDRTLIDGTTQPSYAGKPLIVLRAGGSSYYGLQLQGGSCGVRGLTVGGFSSIGIYVLGSSNIVESCYVGTDATGTFSRPNGIGILCEIGSSYNSIGGSGAGNVISGNSDLGLCLFYSTGNVVQGNFIGTDATGTNALGNVNDGVSIDHAPNNEIGGTGTGEGNLISGNRRDGIRFIDQSATGNVFEGNLIGLDVSGRAALGNIGAGINVNDAPDNTIGGTDPGSRNVISGNAVGVLIQQAHGTGNVVQGNWIGIDVIGSNALPNLGDGVSISSATENTIGGTDSGAGNVISGNMASGVFLGGNSNVVQGNLIGTDTSGTFALPNGTSPALPSLSSGSGIFVLNASAQTIGGDTPEARNIISGNAHNGISFDHAQNSVLQGNWIGLSASGQMLGNSGSGIVLSDSTLNTIGGANPGEGNICSGNLGGGILLAGVSGTTLNAVLGNYVGIAPDGRTPRGNLSGGIAIGAGASGNFIGGSDSGNANVISGNGLAGILVNSLGNNLGSPPSLNVILGNLIGLDAAGQNAAPNLGPGIDINVPLASLQIGGTDPGEANQIAYNHGNGVLVRHTNAVGVTISGNSIFGNDNLGINLQPPGEPANTVTANDNLDADNGPNRLQNSPVITNTVFAGGLTVISGYLRSVANEDFDVEIFANLVADPSGYGEGQIYLGTTNVSTDATGFDEFQLVLTGSFGPQLFTATATRSSTGDTSEFSPSIPTLYGVLLITDIHRSGADVQISFTTDPGTNYKVEWTSQLPNPNPWNTVSGASNVAGTGNIVSIKDTGVIGSSPSQRFYRVRPL